DSLLPWPCSRRGRAGGRLLTRARGPGALAGTREERGLVLRATEFHEGASQIALCGQVGRIELHGAHVGAPRALEVGRCKIGAPLRDELAAACQKECAQLTIRDRILR